MKHQIIEKNKLPLTFKYIEKYRTKNPKENGHDVYYIKCKKYQTDFLIQVTPNKPLTRML